MRIYATGDHHFGAGPRWSECLRIHDWIAERVEAERPDAFMSAGDVYERASTPAERLEVAKFFERVADVCPVVIARGNHDRHRDLALLARLRTRYPVIVEEGAGVHVVETPRGGAIVVAACAWPSRPSIARALGDDASPETIGDRGRELLGRVFQGLGAAVEAAREELRAEGLDRAAAVLLGHAHVVSARVRDDGQPLPFGETIAVGLEDLALVGADATILGHIHLPQAWEPETGPVIYTGSPFRTSFGEVEPKSIVRLEVGEATSFDRLATPAQPMELLEARVVPVECPETGHEYSGLALAALPSVVEGAELRLRYHVEDPADRPRARADAEAWRARWIAEGAAAVKIEERYRPRVRARAPAVAAARSTADRLRAWWRAAEESAPDAAAQQRILGRLAELEGEIER